MARKAGAAPGGQSVDPTTAAKHVTRGGAASLSAKGESGQNGHSTGEHGLSEYLRTASPLMPAPSNVDGSPHFAEKETGSERQDSLPRSHSTLGTGPRGSSEATRTFQGPRNPYQAGFEVTRLNHPYFGQQSSQHTAKSLLGLESEIPRPKLPRPWDTAARLPCVQYRFHELRD